MYKRIKVFFIKPFWYLYYLLLKLLYGQKRVYLYWFNMTQNFGDTINPLFVSALSGKKVLRVDPKFAPITHTIAIGSVIEHCSKDSLIWGSGFISDESEFKTFPKKVLAVRGPKTRERLLNYGIECPEVYGDPALLFPQVYFPKVEKKYTLGFVPHHSDKDNEWIKNNVQNNPNYKVIDLQKLDVWEIIDDILSCERIVSSSLHGIITADAYGIPSTWIEFSDKVIGKGFKFLDYFSSVGRRDKMPLSITSTTSIQEIESQFYDYKISIDLEKLMNAAPFKIDLQPIVRGKIEI